MITARLYFVSSEIKLSCHVSAEWGSDTPGD